MIDIFENAFNLLLLTRWFFIIGLIMSYFFMLFFIRELKLKHKPHMREFQIDAIIKFKRWVKYNTIFVLVTCVILPILRSIIHLFI